MTLLFGYIHSVQRCLHEQAICSHSRRHFTHRRRKLAWSFVSFDSGVLLWRRSTLALAGVASAWLSTKLRASPLPQLTATHLQKWPFCRNPFHELNEFCGQNRELAFGPLWHLQRRNGSWRASRYPLAVVSECQRPPSMVRSKRHRLEQKGGTS